ncbi:hypothetical protein BV898_15550 [Hypsibius exemplaris]|uniref:Uncharacterized protein n=1 Tax=Hypsibius exemplaris TaxID=2072580 RepID=A0A9X6RKC3_HYPEX|nr:hypothetical protein BV898_15550 [Hypsibius exemplaris]
MWKEQHKIDHERHYQSPQVYAVWNEKVHFLREAAEENAFDSDYFLWTDIGSFRDADRVKHLTTFPDTRVTATLLGTKKIFFLQMGRFTESDRIIGANGLPKQNFQHHVRLGAGIFGGHLDAVREYHARFFETLEKMRLHGIFVGKEQNVMSSVAVMYPQLIKLVDPQPYLNGGDAWFYSQYYFSKRNLTAKELE